MNKQIRGILAVLIAGYVGWLSYTVVQVQKDVAVIKAILKYEVVTK